MSVHQPAGVCRAGFFIENRMTHEKYLTASEAASYLRTSKSTSLKLRMK
jgi:hypothetical protein